jgi:hypothetical protein
MKIDLNRIFIILGVLVLSVTKVFAAAEPPPPALPPVPPPLPLDGALFVLLLFSVTYGTYKLLKIKKASS